MDFASLMAKEISKAKDGPSLPGAAETAASPSQPSSSSQRSTEKKYLRRAELEAARIAAYKEEQERLQREREEKLRQKRKWEEEEAERRHEREEKKRRLAEESRRKREMEEAAKEKERRRKLGLPELPTEKTEAVENDEDGDEGGGDNNDDELIRKLREMGEPARLFGETHQGRRRRYRRLVERSRSSTPQQSKASTSHLPIPTILEPVAEKEMKISPVLPKDAEARAFLFRQLTSYFNMVLSEWELALSQRDLAVKQSFQGRQAYNAMVQSKENLRPLFRKLEKNDLENGILEPVLEIVHKAQLRRYVDANDAYLRLSIGKAYVIFSSP